MRAHLQQFVLAAQTMMQKGEKVLAGVEAMGEMFLFFQEEMKAE